MELFEPFEGHGAREGRLDLATTSAVVLARVEGQVEISVPHDRFGGETDAPASDHQAGPLRAAPLHQPIGVSQEQPLEDLFLLASGWSLLPSTSVSPAAAPEQLIPQLSGLTSGGRIDPP